MNYRPTKTAYNNNNDDTETIGIQTDDLEAIGTSNTTDKELNRKREHKQTKASLASTNATSNATQHSNRTQPLLRALDKALIDANANEEQVERAIDKLKQLAKKNDRVMRITSQSRNWAAVFVADLEREKPVGHSLNPKVTLYFDYRGNANANVPFRMQLNPHKLNRRHTNSLIRLWEAIWPIGWREMYSDSGYFRVDEAIDEHGDSNNLILDRKNSQVTRRIFTQTGRDGKIKTSYIGEDSSENGGTLYDRYSAEVYRNADAEPVPFNRETATHILDQVKGVIRIESRRLFATKLTYAELLQTPSAFSEYYLFDLSRLPPRDRRDLAFMGYVEIVRLRGMHGAKHRVYEMLGKTASTKRVIADYESRLARAQCEWWTQLDRTQQLGKLLESLPVNKFLKRIGT